MSLPFTHEQFLETFRLYNSAIGPAPFLLALLAVALVVFARGRAPWRHRAIGVGLAVLWLWAGVVYHMGFFSRINPLAKVFGIAFIVQGLLFLLSSVRFRIQFSPPDGRFALAGWTLIGYAVLVYPVLGWLEGRGYPAGPSFGAPCPMVIFTLGMLTWTTGRGRLALAAIPIAWAAIGTSAATALGITEDYGLAVAALLMGVSLWLRRRPGSTTHVVGSSAVKAA